MTDLAPLAARLGTDAESLARLLAGVRAAPAGWEAEAWQSLLPRAPDATDRQALAAALDALPRPSLPTRDAASARLAALRALLPSLGIDGVVVPHEDEWRSEYLAPAYERLAALTGFTGSAGLAYVSADRAVLFVDGRYTSQGRTEAPDWEQRHLVYDPFDLFARAELAGRRIGFDPRLHTEGWATSVAAALEASGGALVALETNPLDAVWTDRPAPPLAPLLPFPDAQAGESHREKRARLAASLAEQGVAAALLTQSDSLCWLLNVRGGDLPCTPFTLGTALLRADGTATLFVDPRKLPAETRAHLGNEVAVEAESAWPAALDALAGSRVLVDAGATHAWALRRLEAAGAVLVRGPDPVQLPKAKKNATELQGFRDAHLRDGVAIVRFLSWLARAGGDGRQDEITAAAQLLAFRAEQPRFRGPSFETISAVGPNGAFPHYRSSPATNRPLTPGEMYLVDSGGQYLDGTTDLTRTLFLTGPDGAARPTETQRRHFTLVLRGHIALASIRFPQGTTGGQLDTLAREPLWREGLNFDHGTGHGVGHYLSVHEGPQGFSRRGVEQAIEPGMVTSNEPGLYLEGQYGIRIETLLAAHLVPDARMGTRPVMAFETLTLAPVDRTLIDATLLTAAERAWLDAYHARVRETLAPLLPPEDAAWLAAATAPL